MGDHNLTLIGLALVLGGLSGCVRPAGYERYTPPSDTARQALQAVLDSWQSRMPLAEPIDGPSIQVEDELQKRQRPLIKFEILGEVRGESGRWFEVQLELGEPAESRLIRYVVIGIDPLWVMRQEEYTVMTHWDHIMPESTDNSRAVAEP